MGLQLCKHYPVYYIRYAIIMNQTLIHYRSLSSCIHCVQQVCGQSKALYWALFMWRSFRAKSSRIILIQHDMTWGRKWLIILAIIGSSCMNVYLTLWSHILFHHNHTFHYCKCFCQKCLVSFYSMFIL